MATINYYLQQTAKGFFIQYTSKERKYISDRIISIRKNIKAYFGKGVSEVILFGSHARGTNLPRELDGRSDIDVLIVFDQAAGAFTTETYRNQLRRFAKHYYPRTPTQKSYPSVVLLMQKVMFDLVPARLQKGYFSDAYQIPDRNNDWVNTEPQRFSAELARINKRHGSTIKPIIRLLKRWNAYNGYPYSPYEFEQILAGLYFRGKNHEQVFLETIRQLHTRSLTRSAAAKVTSLKKNGAWVEEYLRRDEQTKAIQVVDRILGLVIQ